LRTGANCAPDTPYDPNWKTYSELNASDILRLYTIRTEADSELVGYATFLVHKTLHSKDTLHALHDSMYILKPNRKNGTVKNFINYIEKELTLEGVDTMVISVIKHRDFSGSLKQLGFVHNESTFIKRIA